MANVTVKAMLMRTWPKWAAEIVICVYSFSQPLSPFNYVLRSLWWCNGRLFSSEQMMAVVWELQIPERGVQCPEVWKLLTLWGGGWNPNLAVQLWLKLLLDLNVRAMRGIWTTFPMLVLRLVVQSSVFRTQACSRYWLKVHSTYSDQFIFESRTVQLHGEKSSVLTLCVWVVYLHNPVTWTPSYLKASFTPPSTFQTCSAPTIYDLFSNRNYFSITILQSLSKTLYYSQGMSLHTIICSCSTYWITYRIGGA